jgi:hypothetical protein
MRCEVHKAKRAVIFRFIAMCSKVGGYEENILPPSSGLE